MRVTRIIPQQDQSDLERYLAELRRQDKAPATIASYARGLRDFAAYFSETNGEHFVAASITSLDVAEYKAHLRTA